METKYVYKETKNGGIVAAFIDETVCPDTISINNKEYKFIKDLPVKETGYKCKGHYKTEN